MRLVNTATLELESFYDIHVPEYAILSHTWADGEVSLQDWADRDNRRFKPGFHKIKAACAIAARDGLDYLWADTNCIDKASSAELSEAINSMFKWYQRSRTCYAHLEDVAHASIEDSCVEGSEFRRARWFTRGWTLQELIAPTAVQFFSRDWQLIGPKSDMKLALAISDVTGISPWCLRRGMFSKLTPLRAYSVAQRLAWASRRSTTRVEDQAYSLLGLFDITMPLVYGEGSEAFTRLLEEIIRKYTDHSIFASLLNYVDFLPRSPREFCDSQAVATGTSMRTYKLFSPVFHSYPFQMTNSGLQMTLPIVETLAPAFAFGVLDCWDADSGTTETTRSLSRIWIPMLRKGPQRIKQFTRLLWPQTFLSVRLVPGREFVLHGEHPDTLGPGPIGGGDDDAGVKEAKEVNPVDLVAPDSYQDIIIRKPYSTILSVPKWQPREAASPFLLCFPRGTANYRLYGVFPSSSAKNAEFSDQVASGLPLIQSRELGQRKAGSTHGDVNDKKPTALYGAVVIFKKRSSNPPSFVAIYLINLPEKTLPDGTVVYQPHCKVKRNWAPKEEDSLGGGNGASGQFKTTDMVDNLLVTVQKTFCSTPAPKKGSEHRSVGLTQVVFDRRELVAEQWQSLNALHVAPGGLLDYVGKEFSDDESR